MASVMDSYLWLYDCFSGDEAHVHKIREIVYSHQSAFQKIEIFDLESHGRSLVLDGEVQSFTSDEFVYHEALVQPAMTLHDEPKRALVVGGGEGATLREVLRHPSIEEAVMVEIDGAMIEAARTHLPTFHAGAFDDPRTTLFVGDGRAYLTENETTYDVMIMDITNPREGGLSWQLFTQEFYGLAAKRLASGGYIVIHGDIARIGGLSTFPRLVKTMRSLFDTVRPYVTCISSYAADWGFVLSGGRRDPRTQKGEDIDRRLAERGITDLQFYDGVTHERVFRLPKYVRRSIADEQLISTDDKPIQEKFPGVRESR